MNNLKSCVIWHKGLPKCSLEKHILSKDFHQLSIYMTSKAERVKKQFQNNRWLVPLYLFIHWWINFKMMTPFYFEQLSGVIKPRSFIIDPGFLEDVRENPNSNTSRMFLIRKIIYISVEEMQERKKCILFL